MIQDMELQDVEGDNVLSFLACRQEIRGREVNMDVDWRRSEKNLFRIFPQFLSGKTYL